MLEQNQNERWKGKVKNGDVSLLVSCWLIYLMSGNWNSTLFLIQCNLLVFEITLSKTKFLLVYQLKFKLLCGHANANLLNLFALLVSRKRKLDTSLETSSS